MGLKHFAKALIFMLPLDFFLLSPGLAREQSPYLPGAYWPVMRGDLRNSGRARFCKWEQELGIISEPKRFPTGNSIFSTPVIDDQERIYVGSADHYFYAFDPVAGKELFRFKTGEIIDSAGALGKEGIIYFPSGDSRLYALSLEGKELWAFDVLSNRPKELFSLSTNYWWEGNVVIGPDRALYAGNDDFYFYCLEPDGKLRWAFRTGFFIWSAAAFDDQGLVYVASFDMNLYALEQKTGRLRWKKDLKTPLVASPALNEEGIIFQAGMDGRLYALKSKTGELKWVAETQGHLYASPALSEDGLVYITSTDGRLYAFDAESGEKRWTYYTGDALRSSPVLGPDPEGKEKYLIYFGGGEGMVYALEPTGKRRWSYDTLVNSPEVDYPSINASPALGKRGIAIASSNGEVIYIPYDYYLRKGAIGINREPTDGFPEKGASFYYVSPGGLMMRNPISDLEKDAEMLEIHSSQIINLRLLVREGFQNLNASLEPNSVKIQTHPNFRHRLEFQAEGRTIHIVPEEILRTGTDYLLKISAGYKTERMEQGTVSAVLRLRTEPLGAENPLANGQYPGFKIFQMAVPIPAIVPSLDQIGIASTSIPFVVLEADPEQRTFVAWAVQRFGQTETGEMVGVPDPRSLLYAFAGRWSEDNFIMEAENCFMEATGFPMPLDKMRFSGALTRDGSVKRGASLILEFKPKSKLQALSSLNATAQGEDQKSFLSAITERGGSKEFLEALMDTAPALLKMLTRRVWKYWGFYNQEHKFVGVGTFRMKPLSPDQLALKGELRVLRFEYEEPKQKLVAEILGQAFTKNGLEAVIAILVIDQESKKPLPLNYNLALKRETREDGVRRISLSLPKSLIIPKGKYRAYLFSEMVPLKTIEF